MTENRIKKKKWRIYEKKSKRIKRKICELKKKKSKEKGNKIKIKVKKITNISTKKKATMSEISRIP